MSAKIYSPDALTGFFGAGVPYSLDEDDRQAFAEVLPKLPHLRCPMSEEERASFMEAYVKLPNRPIWMPLLETEETILARMREHDKVISKHVDALRREHRAGRLAPVNAHYVPVEAVEIGAQVTREDAIAYLKRHGLAFDDGETVANSKQDTVSSEVAPQSQKLDEETATGLEQDSVSSEVTPQSHNADQLTLNGKKKRGCIEFDATTKAKAVMFCNELKTKGEKKFVKKTAEKFETTERSIYTWVQEAEKTDLLTILERNRKN